MLRMPIILAVLGLACSSVVRPASAQQPFELTLFGRKYQVVRESRAQTYKNGKAVVMPPFGAGNRKANLWFTQGADPSQDRLFVVAPIFEDDTVTGHQFYLLTGADANGVFSPSAATLTEFFGGNVNGRLGGRPVAVMHINDENTGASVDRNLALTTFTGNDTYRYYDLDSLSRFTSAVSSRLQRAESTGGDPNAPWGGFVAYAPGPGGTMVTFGATQTFSGVEIGVTDPKQNSYFPVLTNLSDVTSSTAIPFPTDYAMHSAFLYGGDPAKGTGESWLLASSSAPHSDSDSTEKNQIWRVRLRFPTDLATATRGSIQAEVLGPPQELKGTPLHTSDGGVFGMAVGREVAPGLRRLYFADWQGNLCTATPLP